MSFQDVIKNNPGLQKWYWKHKHDQAVQKGNACTVAWTIATGGMNIAFGIAANAIDANDKNVHGAINKEHWVEGKAWTSVGLTIGMGGLNILFTVPYYLSKAYNENITRNILYVN